MDGPAPRFTPEVADDVPQPCCLPRPPATVSLQHSDSGRRASRSARHARSIKGVHFISASWYQASSISFANAANPRVEETPPVAQEVHSGRASSDRRRRPPRDHPPWTRKPHDADEDGGSKRPPLPAGPSTLSKWRLGGPGDSELRGRCAKMFGWWPSPQTRAEAVTRSRP